MPASRDGGATWNRILSTPWRIPPAAATRTGTVDCEVDGVALAQVRESTEMGAGSSAAKHDADRWLAKERD
jgi:hypothetical protein